MSHWKTSADFLHDLQNILKMSGSFLGNSTSSSDGIQVQLLQKIIFFFSKTLLMADIKKKNKSLKLLYGK